MMEVVRACLSKQMLEVPARRRCWGEEVVPSRDDEVPR